MHSLKKDKIKQCNKPFLPFTGYIFAYNTKISNPKQREGYISHAISFFQKNQDGKLHDKLKLMVIPLF